MPIFTTSVDRLVADFEAERKKRKTAPRRFRRVEQRLQPPAKPRPPPPPPPPDLTGFAAGGELPELSPRERALAGQEPQNITLSQARGIPEPEATRPPLGRFAAFSAIGEALDVPRKELGRPAARFGILEPLAQLATAGEAIAPARIPGVPSIRGFTEPLFSAEELRSGLATEIVSYITDPLNLAAFPGKTVQVVKLAARGAKLTAAQRRLVQPAVRTAREALTRQIPAGARGSELGAVGKGPKGRPPRKPPAEQFPAGAFRLQELTTELNRPRITRARRAAIVKEAEGVRAELARQGFTPDQIRDFEGVPRAGTLEARVPEAAPAAPQAAGQPPVEARAPEAPGAIEAAPPGPPGRPPTPPPAAPRPLGELKKVLSSRVLATRLVRGKIEKLRSAERGRRAARAATALEAEGLTEAQRTRAALGQLKGEQPTIRFTPLDITDDELDILMAEAQRVQKALPYRNINTRLALADMRDGVPIPPHRIQMIEEVLGKEVAAALRTRQAKIPAHLRPSLTEPERAEAAIVIRDEEALRKLTGKANEETLAMLGAAQKGDDAAIGQARRFLKARNRATETAIRRLRRMEAALEARQTKAEARALGVQNRRDARLRANFDKRYPTTEMLRNSARDLAATAIETQRGVPHTPGDVKTIDEIGEAIKYWSEGNRAMLDGIGETEGLRKVTRLIESSFAGNATDSFVATLATRQGFLETGLVNMGLDAKASRKIARLLFDAEIEGRYGPKLAGKMPQPVADSINQLRRPVGARDFEGVARFSERMKNTMFGVGDMAIFMIQGRAAVAGGVIPSLMGSINRTLTLMHHPLFPNLYLSNKLPKHVRNMLDGLHYGRGPSIVTGTGETVFAYGGKPLEPVDRLLANVSTTLADFQFRTVLGGVRDSLMEGNLMILHLLRQDISRPAVRAKAARWANTLTGWAEGAQTVKRRAGERSIFISPSMTRAQVQEVLLLTKLISPKAATTDRLLASLALASYGTSWLMAAKLIDDYFGNGDMILDPTKPGAGIITFDLPGAPTTSIPIFANVAIKRAILRSIRDLAEGDLNAAYMDWVRPAVGRLTTVAGLGASVAGVGYTPQGRFSTDLSQSDRLIRFLPLPPILQEALFEGWNPTRLALEFTGTSQFERPAFLQLRDAQDTYASSQGFEDFEEMEEKFGTRAAEQAAREAVPELVALEEQEASEVEERFGTGIGAILADKRVEQERLDAELPEWAPWRQAKKENDIAFGGQIARYLIDNPDAAEALGRDAPEDPFAVSPAWTPDEVVAAFFETMRLNSNPQTGQPLDRDEFSEALDRFTGLLTPEQQELLDANLGTRATDRVKEYQGMTRQIAATGYWDVDEKLWARPELFGIDPTVAAQYPSFRAWKAFVHSTIRDRVAQETDPASAETMADVLTERVPAIEAYSKLKAAIRTAMREQKPDLLRLLNLLGFKEGALKDIPVLAGVTP